jgi:hypothetical protein
VSAGHPYSRLDQFLHRVAFASSAIQQTAADVEQAMYGSRFRHIPVDRPVFVTSLPRAGTTLVLELLAAFPDVATHRYRDMPFIMAPIFWAGLSKHFRKPAALVERAHGDGMMVGYDSPEAFEEVLWKAFWPKHFTADGIRLWKDDEPAREYREVLTSHLQRILAVRSEAGDIRRRYVSKNNANVARIGFLKRLFPDAQIVVPFRDPLAQAASLLRQHQRFLKRHRDDPFGRQYMEDIGHLEFGQLHRPIAFDGMEEVRRRYQPDSLDYWVGYWFHGLRHVAARQDRVMLVSYERLCAGGQRAIRALTDRLGLSENATGKTSSTGLHEPRTIVQTEEDVQDKGLLEAAYKLHGLLLQRSVVGLSP